MSKPNQLTSLRVEDFPAEQRAWLPRLFLPLNQVLLSVYNILNGRTEFGPNVPCLDQTLNFFYANAAQTVAWTVMGQPKILWVGQATVDGVAIALQPSWQFDASNNKISVNFFKLDGSALTEGSQYNVFIRVVP